MMKPFASAIFALMALCAGTASPAAEEVKTPAWLAGKALNEWLPIEGTAGAGGAPVNDFCGMAFRPGTCEIVIAAAGGHGGSNDNRVVSIDLRADAPKWVQRCAPSADRAQNVAYNADGKPTSRHTYHSSLYVPSLDRVMLVGNRFTWPGAHEHPKLDGFDLAANKWDPAGTWPDVPKGGGYGVVADPATGDLWTQGLMKWTPATKTWSSPITKRARNGVRFPYAFDTKRNQIFGLNVGDGQGYGDMNVVTAVRVPAAGNESIQVTIKPGEALEQFKKDKPVYSGMDYDPDGDRFLFYNGVEKADAGRIYAVKPADGNEWEMSILTLGPGSKHPPPAGGAGINNRFRYAPGLKGFVLLASGKENLYFIRTAGK
ncbi:MAG TPA: hypothetical protein PK280_05890 [Planctomycetota bacterium]|nr:hypothetical protein [Planctomycetota bacterium]